MKISAIAVLILSFNLKSAVYEIRDFMPYGKERIEIVDFWVSRGDEAIVEGTNPIVSPNGQPNVTWVAKYDSREDRDTFFANLDVDPEWEEVWSKHPNPDAYIHSNARFFSSIK